MAKRHQGLGYQAKPADLRFTAGQIQDFVRAFASAIAECLEQIVTDRVVRTIESTRQPTLLDRVAIAEQLDISLPTLDRLRKEGCPFVMIGDAPRFEVDRVLEWLRSRATEE